MKSVERKFCAFLFYRLLLEIEVNLMLNLEMPNIYTFSNILRKIGYFPNYPTSFISFSEIIVNNLAFTYFI